MTVKIDSAQTGDLPALFALLEDSGLPTAGLAAHLATTLVAHDGERLVGSAALELYGSEALLRSVAVAAPLRGQGLGEQLTHSALELARLHCVQQVSLLTETAQQFFARFGFHPIARTEVSSALHQSIEWTSACPVTAQAMTLRLGSSEKERIS
jgi:amino-acid N-acetyltransferase